MTFPRSTQRHRLGRSDVEVTRLGLGTAPLGGLFTHVEDDVAAAVVQASLDAGLTYVDTAPLYGHGVSERRVGAALADAGRSSYALSTKVGRLIVDNPDGASDGYADAPPSEAIYDYTADGIRRSLEESLERLGMDAVDIVYIHDPDDHEEAALTTAYPVLHELRAQGVVGAIGVGMNQSRIPTRFVRETEIDAVLLAGRYTLLDQSGEADLLPACLDRGTSIVIGGVYNSGLLADPRPGATFNYVEAPAELVAQAQKLADICAEHGVPLKAAAIQFPLAHPAVATILTGARSVAELDENLAMMEYAIPDTLWDELAAAGVHRYGH
ncbi:aldo/keto reductase [Actinopolymorpha alba]|uniref:aldo/keto reductase n=1 Tax=Actinopolymorpha alba TaxID=533267 RepID=UPI0003727A53|nr:aldo/keto reductase [Actinopolymorpha alba]